jgi:plasmid stability protein
MLSALVPRGQVEGLRELAREHDRSVSAEIRQALRVHLGAQEGGHLLPPSGTRPGAAPERTSTPRPDTLDDAA